MLLKQQKLKEQKMKQQVIMAKRDQGSVREHFAESRYAREPEKICV
jgi:hypothetical protein